MSKIYYPYRIKTEEEFIKEYGEKWRVCCDEFSFINDMDYLLGKTIELSEEKINSSIKTLYNTKYFTILKSDVHEYWFISMKYIIKKIPNYKPKKFIREI
jgi:hypothetical protein